MNNKVFLGLVFVLMLAIPGLTEALETSLGGEMWSRWTLSQGRSPADSSSVWTNNSMALERGYIDLKTKFSGDISSRFTVDLFSTDALKDGAGIKLKYAFVDFGNIIPLKDAKLSVGLQKVYFGSIYDWDYTLIGKAPVDEYKLASSADYGISVNGYLPAGWGTYALGIYNGEGYKKYGDNLKDNVRAEYLANLRIIPVAGVTLGASMMTNSVEREKAIATDVAVPGYQEQLLMDALARFVYGPADILVEYLYKDVEYSNVAGGGMDYSARGISIIPVLNLKDYVAKDIQLTARYDRWDETDNSSNKHLLTAITGGINYNFMHSDGSNPALQLQLNATQKTYDENESAAAYANKLKDSFTLMAQLKWRFSHKLK